jgi:hypothetical protein
MRGGTLAPRGETYRDRWRCFAGASGLLRMGMWMVDKRNDVVLKDTRYNGSRCTMMAALEGALRAVGRAAEWHEIYGLTGHAFVMAVNRGVTEMGALGFHWPHLLELGQSLGYRVTAVSAGKGNGDLRQKQEEAWALVRASIDRGHPVIAFGIHAPEFYLIYGYRPLPEGIYFLGLHSDRARQPGSYALLGETRPGVLFAAAIAPDEPDDERSAVRGALEFAVGFFESGGVGAESFDSPRWGKAAYDEWVESLEASPFLVKLSAPGIAHNAALWAECKERAGEFLEWAAVRFPGQAGDALVRAADGYGLAATLLRYLERLLPEDAGDMANDPNLRREAAHLVRLAMEAESRGIEWLKQSLSAL